MDIFWLVPFAIVVIAFLVGFAAYLIRHPESSSNPNVLVDKPADEPAIDPETEAHDWEKRPCGSYLDWLYGSKK